jgi:hypothetical protein|tara:strand:+ start:1755 stop:2165 length:411 start_codon:yes stop_codon:yes gene_type:complete
MMQALLPLLTPILGDVLKRLIPDADKRDEIERETKLALLEHSDSIERVRGEIILAEARSSGWLTSSWRPLLMLVVIAIIAVNYLVFPLVAIWYPQIMANLLALPDQLWNLLTLGVGGYVVGRSGEKMIDSWTGKGE